MVRTIAFLGVLSACSIERSIEPTPLEGIVGSDDLYLEVTANLTRCNGWPCTEVEARVFRTTTTGSTYAEDVTGWISFDGAAAERAEWIDESAGGEPGAGKLRRAIDGWAGKILVATHAGADEASLSSERDLSTPYDAAIEFPDEVVLGSSPSLTWDHQGRPVQEQILVAAALPFPHFALATLPRNETGSFEIDRGVFSARGDYTIGLVRSLSHYPPDDSSQLVATWISTWQKQVAVIEPPAP